MLENIILIIGSIISMALCYVLACLLTEKCCGIKKTRQKKTIKLETILSNLLQNLLKN